MVQSMSFDQILMFTRFGQLAMRDVVIGSLQGLRTSIGETGDNTVRVAPAFSTWSPPHCSVPKQLPTVSSHSDIITYLTFRKLNARTYWTAWYD